MSCLQNKKCCFTNWDFQFWIQYFCCQNNCCLLSCECKLEFEEKKECELLGVVDYLGKTSFFAPTTPTWLGQKTSSGVAKNLH